MAMNAMGVKKYQVVGPSDGKTCWYCHAMLNREFSVAADMEYANEILTSSKEEQSDIKAYSISNRFHNDVPLLESLSAAEVQAGGPAHPPYHPNCRHTIVPIFSPTGTPIAPPEPAVTPPSPEAVETPSATTESLPVSPSAQDEYASAVAPDTLTPLTEKGILDFVNAFNAQKAELAAKVGSFREMPSLIPTSTYQIKMFQDPATGERWIWKGMGKRGAAAEESAYLVSQILNPGNRAAVFAGEPVEKLGFSHGTLQRYIPNTRQMAPGDIARCDPEQLEFLMREQVVDRILYNKDSHDRNFLVNKNTGQLIAIDKGQSWKWGTLQRFGLKADNSTVYYDLAKYIKDMAAAGNLPASLNVKETLSSIVERARTLATRKNLKLLVEAPESASETNIVDLIKKSTRTLTSEVNNAYQQILNDPSFTISGKTPRATATPEVSPAEESARKIFGGVSNRYIDLYKEAYNTYSQKTVAEMNKEYFYNQHPLIGRLLSSWVKSSSSYGAILLKAVANDLENLGGRILNSRSGSIPTHWDSQVDFVRSAINDLRAHPSADMQLAAILRRMTDAEIIERAYTEYVKSRAFTQAYLTKVGRNRRPTFVYRGAKLSNVHTKLLSGPYPVDVEEQVLASFSSDASIARVFGNYSYRVKPAPEDIVFHRDHFSLPSEGEYIIRTKGRRTVAQNDVIKKTERILVWIKKALQEKSPEEQEKLLASVKRSLKTLLMPFGKSLWQTTEHALNSTHWELLKDSIVKAAGKKSSEEKK